MRYKLLSMMLLLCMVWVMPQAASATSAANFTLTLDNDKPKTGDLIQVTVSGQGLSDLFAYEVTLEFDTNRLTYNSWTHPASGYAVDPIVTGNRLVFAYTKVGTGTGFNGNMDLGTIKFTTSGKGDAGISLKGVKLVDSKLATNEQSSVAQVTAKITGQDMIPGMGNPPTSNGPKKHEVSIDDISKPAQNGKVEVSVSGDADSIVIPANSGNLLGNNKLSIQTDKLTLDLPSEVLSQLAGKVSSDELQDSSIELNVTPLADTDANQLLKKGQATHTAQLRQSGQVFEFSLSLVQRDGTTVQLTNFDQPLTIHLKLAEGVNPKLSGIYYIADDGTLEYIGGKQVNDEMVAKIHHFSKYALLEFKKLFADVASSHWAAASIEQLTAQHILNGTGADTFEPERSVTRAEFTAMLVRGLNLTEASSQTFADVGSADWYAQPISIAVKAGIVTGKSANSFAPNAQITREEMVTMMMRAYAINKSESVAGTSASSFSDEDNVSPWALKYVREAASLQFVNGREAGKFVPSGVSTRAEAAAILTRILAE